MISLNDDLSSCTFRKFINWKKMDAYMNVPRYVNVKLATKKSLPPKKMIIPKNFAALKKAAQKAFNLKESIGGFQNQKGDLIDDIRDILDGNTIYAVPKSKMDNLSIASSTKSSVHSNISITLSQSSIQNENISIMSESSQRQPLQNKSSNKDNSSVSKVSTPSIKLTINNKPKTPTNVANKNNKAATPTIRINSQSNKSSAANSTKPVKLTIKSGASSTKPQTNDDDSDFDNYDDETDYDDELSYSEDDGIPDTEGEEIMRLLIPKCEEDFTNSINEAFYAIMPETREFLSNLLKMEEVQKARYFNELQDTLKQFGMYEYNKNWIHLEEMEKKAKSMIHEHRYPGLAGYNYVMKTAIVGPEKAGKSTFLYVYLRELLIDLIASDNWKNTFVFPYDISLFVEGMVDLKQFYHDYIHYIFALLQVQCPHMIPVLPSIEQCFDNITEFKGKILLPKKLTQNLELKRLSSSIEELVSLLARIWNDPEQFEVWIGNLAFLPQRLAKAFGFKQIIHVFDHFDMSNCSIDPPRPFVATEYCSFPSELLKCAIIQGPFILAAKDSFTFFDSLEAIDDTVSLNLRNAVDVFYLWNLIDKSLYSDKEIYVKFAETDNQLKITSYACGGIPNYLIKWNQMNKMFDEYDEIDDDSPDKEEKYCEVISVIENIIYQIFTSDKKGERYNVEDVRRKTKE